MRKELILAIVAGSFLGLVIAFGIWRANVAFSPRKGTEATPTPTTMPTSDFKITLAKPKNDQVITETPTIISGVTKQNSYVVVSAEDLDYITKSDTNSQFEVKADLNGGTNQLKVAAFDGTGASTQTNILVVYSSEFAKDQTSTTQNATPSADAIRQKVQEKLDQVESNPMATLGTITDITDNTIQIKTQTGEIQLVSIDKQNTTFIKTKGDTTKEIKFSDVAIGDFIVAMGTKNTILHAKRVLITDPIKPVSRDIIFGEIVDKSYLKLTLKNPKDGKTTNVEPGDQIKVTDIVNTKAPATRFSHIDQGDTIIAVGKSDRDVFTARTLILIKNAPSPSPTPKS